ncbi:glycoside hydrolase family 98 domain-containing protein [Diplocloster modestus]|uniref:Discoidin domain-containing protein n=1 Tax=Diplocloster modestus TaxID=2850322 RepID=A0ABS6KE90_9FIRM|nr:glycosyl hydrolase family 98 C-terminal domain-containing protein [Diplocloster modestus]MBU9728837.1 discoidin domain-containing protein [Diplocloster modestus]
MKKFVSKMLIALMICNVCLSLLPAQSVKASSVPMRMTIDNSHPLLISAVYGDPTDTLWYGNTLTGAWNAIPDDVKPYSVIELHPGKICKPTSCIPKDTPELRAWYIKMLEEAQAHDIPVMLVIMSAGERNTVPVSWLEEQFKNYSVLKGVLNIENYWIYNNDLATHSAAYVEACAKYGAYFIWHDHKESCWESIMSNTAFYNACKQYKDNVILAFKNTPIAEDARTDSIINGYWLSDLCGNWGGSMDTWKWWEKNYRQAFQGSGRDLRSYCSEPEAMLGMEMMNIYANGGTVYNFECPAYTFASNDTATPAFTKAIVPFFRYTVSHPAPSKQEVLDRTKVAYWSKDGGISGLGNFYNGLSSDDESMPLYDTGRYHIIPIIPKQVTQTEISEKFPGIDIVTKNSSVLTDKVPYFNSKYPKMYDGTAFAQLMGSRWFIYNSNANVDINQTAELPLYTNTCSEVDLEMTPHTYAIVEEQSDSLHIILNNYRVDKTELWQRTGDWSSSWGQGEVNIANWVRDSYAPNPQDTELRTTTVTVKGHTGEAQPVLAIMGDEGHYQYTEDWDAQGQTYTVVINHNGSVDMTINAAGDGPNPAPSPDPYEEPNIALNKTATQSSTLYGAGPERAVDGNADGDYGHGSVTHTDNEAQAWWMVDLGSLYRVGGIEVFNRTDFCSDRLSDFTVSVLDSQQNSVWNSHQTTCPQPSVKVDAQGALGRYVKIQLTGKNNLSLAEVKVNGIRENVALHKTATQSSTLYGAGPARAVDGNTDGAYGNGSVTHTDNNNQPWWMVDLGNTYNLSEVVIYNRTDTASNRLSNYRVSILNADQEMVWSQEQTDYPNPSISLPVNVAGKYVKVELLGKNYLSLAEVQVFAN